MAASTVLSPRSYRYDLSCRDKDFAYFRIPTPVVHACGIAPSMTKRQIELSLSTGTHMRGFCTITSGWEISIPRHLQGELRRADWFECAIIGDQTAYVTTLERVGP